MAERKLRRNIIEVIKIENSRDRVNRKELIQIAERSMIMDVDLR